MDFSWQKIIDDIYERTQSQLFEHRWHDRFFESLFRTTIRLFRPIAVWSDIALEWAPNPLALTSQLLITGALCSLLTCGIMLPHILRTILLVVATVFCTQIFWQTRQAYRIRLSVLFRVLTYSSIMCWLWTIPVLVIHFFCLSSIMPRANGLHELFNLPSVFFFGAFGLGLTRHVRVRRGGTMAVLIAALLATAYITIWVSAAVYFDSVRNPVSLFVRDWLGVSMPGSFMDPSFDNRYYY